MLSNEMIKASYQEATYQRKEGDSRYLVGKGI